ncbi:MAG TPA: polysaccharide pyruvyl transferase family protein [Chthoniobacter sp.]|nr:polysaccharide pyruvyl transferase family protein [Chthoniobacter sp.]
MNRRHFLQLTLVAAIQASVHAAEKRAPRIILRNSWQTVNIGDIGHTPGILHLLEQYLPDAEVRLWPSNIGDGVEELLRKRFPKLIIIKTPEEIKTAFSECDFFLHGSSSGFSAQKHVAQWKTETGKPYGIYGISLTQAVGQETRDIIDNAKFIFFRDGHSLEAAKQEGLKCPVMEYGPDGAFAVDLRNDEAAKKFLSANGLEEGKFMCVIPRYRFTPYWKIHNKPMKPEDEVKNNRSEEMKEHDHAPLREAIVAVIRQTDLKILVCPEDQSQMEIGKTMLVDPLPDDVKSRVVWRKDYWLTDEALSTYVRSAGLFGLEMHSPIMCIGNGVPAIVCRFVDQTYKGLMWRDIGLGDWLFDMDVPEEVARIVPTVLAMAKDPAAAKAKAAKALDFVHQRQRETMGVLKKSLP